MRVNFSILVSRFEDNDTWRLNISELTIFMYRAEHFHIDQRDVSLPEKTASQTSIIKLYKLILWKVFFFKFNLHHERVQGSLKYRRHKKSRNEREKYTDFRESFRWQEREMKIPPDNDTHRISKQDKDIPRFIHKQILP